MSTAPSLRSRRLLSRSLFRTALVTLGLLAAPFLLEADAGAPTAAGTSLRERPLVAVGAPDLGPDNAQ